MQALRTYFAGIDAGSTYTKGALVDDRGALVETTVDMTGINIVTATKKAYAQLLEKAGVSEGQVAYGSTSSPRPRKRTPNSWKRRASPRARSPTSSGPATDATGSRSATPK
jgi:hypothetical protein